MATCVRRLFLLPLLLLGLHASPAGAVALESFACITGNDSGDCAIGEAQLSASLDASGSEAILTVTMTGTDYAVVKSLYLESELITDIDFIGGAGPGQVDFGDANSGGNLPGGNTIDFEEAFSIFAKAPAPRWGVGAQEQDDVSGQSAEFRISYAGSFSGLLDSLRVGVHVIGFESGGSESFVTGAPIPEPATAALLSFGLLGLAVARRH